MNRFKKELRKKGIKLGCDYPCLPYFIKGKSVFEPGYIFVDGVHVNAEKATVTTYYNVIWQTEKMLRDGTLETIYD